jgi:hypothetical protein
MTPETITELQADEEAVHEHVLTGKPLDPEVYRRVLSGGGHTTDPNWTERRLVLLAARTLARLEELAAKIRQQSQLAIEPMQLTGLLLEKTTEQVSDAEAEKLLPPRSPRR